jgi:hypothetical protein
MMAPATATTAAGVAVPLVLLGASDVDACSGKSCAIRPKPSTTHRHGGTGSGRGDA